jgi:CTP synthase
MQCAVVEFARNVLNLDDASSTEIENSPIHPVIDIMEDQKDIKKMGGTMRLGAYTCLLEQDSLAGIVYGQHEISERHRHRYEFNNDYLSRFKEAGMIASGINQETGLVEIMELKNHPWFIATQFHPELKSTVINPHPLFVAFVDAALKHKKNQ